MRLFRAKAVFMQEAQIIPQVISAAVIVRKVKFSSLLPLREKETQSSRSLEEKSRPPAPRIILEAAVKGVVFLPSPVHQEAGI